MAADNEENEMSDKAQYFSLKLNATGNEYDVVFADHDAYVDGVIRTPTMAVGGVENAQHIAINDDGTFSICTDVEMKTFGDFEAAAEFAIDDAISTTQWRASSTTREERLLRVGRE